MSWRDQCKPIIHKVLQDTQGQTEKGIRKALYEAYPFGARAYHPYKVWLSEIRNQRKKNKSKPQPVEQIQLFN